MLLDTIVAPITGLQPAPVAVVRLSGAEAWHIASTVFRPWPCNPDNLRAVFGFFSTGDEGLALPFEEGHGYTGEQAVEFSIHGSPAAVRALIEGCLAGGARLAEPGEFSQRAFLNGKLDLTEAEGVRDTIEAETDRQFRQASLHRQGFLSAKATSLRDCLLGLLAQVEASVDFSEEIGELDPSAALEVLNLVEKQIEVLLTTAPAGRILRFGFRIAIVGPPNAGKSSLLNALLGAERSIVTEVAGTTRDYVEEQADIAGIRCVLFDTAGLRDTAELVESLGIQRSRALASSADEIWYVYDGSVGWALDDERMVASFDRPVMVLSNKSDLPMHESSNQERGHISISTFTRQGFEKLIQHVDNMVAGADSEPLINKRHESLLLTAHASLETCRSTLENDLPIDLLAVGLRDAADRLGELTGETASEDMIERIFRDFCIGK